VRPWQRYPYTADWGDPAWFTFPYVDGYRRDLGMATYFVEGFLRGRSSGRLYAFMTIFTDMRVVRRAIRVCFHTFALFDCDRRRYGTSTDFDFPWPPRFGRRSKLDARADWLALTYRAPNGTSCWLNRRDEFGALRPFAWTVELRGTDHHGKPMELMIEMEATRPPAPLGGRELGGEMMFLGAERTYSYFQSGLVMRGRLRWDAVDEEVEGSLGWIDRQWAVDDFARHQDLRSTRYRNEWRVMHFDNGWEMSCFHQYHRHQRNAVVPWSGMSAQGPAPTFELRATPRVELDIPEFISSPGIVRALSMLTEGPRYFPYRYRMRVPEWDMDVEAEPFIDAPAHRLPIEYWTGPVRLSGRVFGQAVRGYGFDERSRPWVRDFELAAALRITVEHLPNAQEAPCRLLAYRLSEVEALALRRDPKAALVHLQRQVEPLLEVVPATAGSQVAWLVRDLRVVLERKFPRPP
jgi:hypothetical protein